MFPELQCMRVVPQHCSPGVACDKKRVDFTNKAALVAQAAIPALRRQWLMWWSILAGLGLIVNSNPYNNVAGKRALTLLLPQFTVVYCCLRLVYWP